MLPSREQLQAYLSEMLLSPMDGEEEVDRDLPQYASLEECAEALKQCGIGLRSAHQQLFPTAVQSLVVVAAMAVAHWEWWLGRDDEILAMLDCVPVANDAGQLELHQVAASAADMILTLLQANQEQEQAGEGGAQEEEEQSEQQEDEPSEG